MIYVLGLLFFFNNPSSYLGSSDRKNQPNNTPFLVVLGNVQDGGSPHIGCQKSCCKELFEHPDPTRQVVSIGIVDPQAKKTFILEATPDYSRQIELLKNAAQFKMNPIPDGTFITHAHIGHYTGLMYLGKEAKGAKMAPVYVMPKMKYFLENNGPWSQLVKMDNILMIEMSPDSLIQLTEQISIRPFLVPHRDEFSETVGFQVYGPNKSFVFIPDIDKWHQWEIPISDVIKSVDYAFLDATFYDAKEVNHRDISEIPHPFVVESLKTFEALPQSEKSKIYFIHFNHTNPLLRSDSEESQFVHNLGFHTATFGQKLDL